MKVVGIYGSPRKGGNTDILLDKALLGARDAGAETRAVYCRKLKMSGCIECGKCDDTGKCVIDDEMQGVYPLLEEADAVILAVPIFFYGAPAQCKALVDRSQAMWSARLLRKTGKEERKVYDSGKGYMIAVGATKGQNMFIGVELMSKYFYDALDMTYEGGLNVRQVEAKASVLDHPDIIQDAYDLGLRIGQAK